MNHDDSTTNPDLVDQRSADRPLIPDGGTRVGGGDTEQKGKGTKDTNEQYRESTLNRLNLITQITRANLIQNILGHRWMMPSKKELDYFNPNKDPGTISGHLDKLIEGDIIVRLDLPQGERTRKGPNVFYSLTDEGWTLLEEHSLFLPELDRIRCDHASVKKTDEIVRCEQADRPTLNVDYDHPLKGDGWSVVNPLEEGKSIDDLDWDHTGGRREL